MSYPEYRPRSPVTVEFLAVARLQEPIPGLLSDGPGDGARAAVRQADVDFARLVWDFTEKQAQAIIELQLQRLTGMEQEKILEKLIELQQQIAEYTEILGSEAKLRGVIVKELKEVEKEFGDARRTEIVEDTGEIRLEDLVQVEDVAVTVTRGGYLKRTACDTYRRA